MCLYDKHVQFFVLSNLTRFSNESQWLCLNIKRLRQLLINHLH